MVFTLRIDLESNKGIKHGVPKILDLLKKFNFKASFYVCMGGESNLLELLKYRGKFESAGERKIKVFSLKEKLRIALLSKDFVSNNKKILRQILEEGHELGIHGWKHRAWSRGLEKIDISKHINSSIKKYKKIFKKIPYSFATPTFRMNEKVIKILDKKGIRTISDYPGKEPFKIKGTNIVNVPITIKGEKNTPIIEYLVSKGKNDKQILDYIKKEIIKNKISIMYIHGLYECLEKIDLLESFFYYLSKNKIKVKKIEDFAEVK